MHWRVDDKYKSKGIKQEGIVVGEYHFAENRSQKFSGRFDGVFCSRWFIDRYGDLKYDDLEWDCSDSYCNNQFVGTWKSYDAEIPKTCNWGDSRIPQSGDLDIGTGEFYPNDKYVANGWQKLIDAWEKPDCDKKARQEEQRKWWK